jgi:hypothetical protein
MAPISTKTHAIADFATGALLLLHPTAGDARARAILRATGAAALGQALVTDWELAVDRRLPVRRHLLADAATGVTLLASPWLLGLRHRGLSAWLPPVLVGAFELAASALTERQGRGAGAGAPAAEPTWQPHRGLGSADVRGAPIDQPDTGTGPLATPTGDVPDGDREAGLRPDLAPSPVEAPGPSVPAAGPPASTTEVEEQIERTIPDAEELGVAGRDPMERLVAREEAAAAAEAAAIGGPEPDESNDDPAMKPVYEAGGGPDEGFDAATDLLIENASHGDGRGNPLRDAFSPEAESDRETAVHGEADEQTSPSVETPFDPENEDAGEGPRRGAL